MTKGLAHRIVCYIRNVFATNTVVHDTGTISSTMRLLTVFTTGSVTEISPPMLGIEQYKQ